MMPYEHYLKAESLLEDAEALRRDYDPENYGSQITASSRLSMITEIVLEAQAHATLALVVPETFIPKLVSVKQ
jgi:hypothetical protein